MDFEKLIVYQKAKEFNQRINEEVLSVPSIDRILKDQLRRAALSIALNIAEGTSRFSKADRKNFFVVSRGSTFECVAILDLLKSGVISSEILLTLKSLAEEISKMLFVLIRQLLK
ncbi:MAG: four helix bundle protein [Bacteroidia bacterium]|nr:four helix bundle protein [Bacteroidia bacterium]